MKLQQFNLQIALNNGMDLQFVCACCHLRHLIGKLMHLNQVHKFQFNLKWRHYAQKHFYLYTFKDRCHMSWLRDSESTNCIYRFGFLLVYILNCVSTHICLLFNFAGFLVTSGPRASSRSWWPRVQVMMMIYILWWSVCVSVCVSWKMSTFPSR